ncbi:cleavage stimulation factor subunit 2 isoform 2-T2 [Dama dama]|uniref:cleavage stimulation factor subunit 2 isoform X2 n=1 Tax=Cervus canadensis TaxID=1574408 RepID=UPI0018BAED5D|nr:cleavage stimulation factor subunit 2 isoform X2 [Cervus canadensis]XP_043752339.1 cleavage stimulation factor subunit 2 isoform X2 [Cervus elaphus]XP_060993474.1 cleavage stimulation factor subunit 2 isoform X2 [Dama dama]
MAGLTVRDPAVDRSLRSVFVGNIPYEATEEQLKDIFSEVGPVVSFRLVYDRETGKPKGYGFCEYQDQETALSAMRNLNGREFSGRALRVDNAASEKNKEELKSLGTGAPVIESPYGETISPEDAPESISKAVASLPPEQMFELMKQMKLCVQNSPQEARNMLLQNPQLAYALLQAQVVMRIVDPEIALKILHRQTNIPTLIAGNPQTVHSAGPGSGSSVSMNQQNPQAPQAQTLSGMHVNGAPPLMQASLQAGVAAPGQIPATVTGPGPGSLAPGGGMQAQVGMPGSGPVSMERGQGGRDPRGIDARGMEARAMEARGLDARGLEARAMEARAMEARAMEARAMEARAMEVRGMEARSMDTRGPVPGPRGPIPSGIQGPSPINMGAVGPQGSRQVPVMQGAGMQGGSIQGGGQPGGFSPGQNQVTPQDHEKAALIMQVLQLTADQIAMLPPEQRQSILILKEQIQKSTGAP